MERALPSPQTKDENGTWAELKEGKPTPKQCPAQRRNEMQRMKTQELIHTARVKQALKYVVESDKLVGNGKCMRARKAMDSYGSGARIQGLGITYLYPANIREVDRGLVVRESVIW